MRIVGVCLSLLLAVPSLTIAAPDDGGCDEPADSTGDLLATLGDVVATTALPVAEPARPEFVVTPPRLRDELPFHVPGLSDEKLAAALRAYGRADERGLVANPRLTIIDYSLPSTQRRLWVIDPTTGAVLMRELVAHGQGSGDNVATRFGNTNDSHRTSLGVFRTAETYSGKHGYSLKLDGHDPGVNDAARRRAIVIHAADYVSDAFARARGRIGRSHGCPAVNPGVSRRLIDEIRGGSIVVSFGGDDSWVARSPLARP